jgi:hypothetical protein
MKYNDYDECCENKERHDDTARFKEVDKVCIGHPKPCITTILEGSVKVEIKKTKIDKNCDGFRLCIEGCKYIKIKYCSNDKCACNKIFTDTFVVPFTESIKFCGCYRDLCDINAYVYHCSMEKLSSRCVCVKTIICVEPEFERIEYEDWDDNWDCNCRIIDSCDCRK